jgi:hypothetical protein
MIVLFPGGKDMLEFYWFNAMSVGGDRYGPGEGSSLSKGEV